MDRHVGNDRQRHLLSGAVRLADHGLGRRLELRRVAVLAVLGECDRPGFREASQDTIDHCFQQLGLIRKALADVD